MPLKCHTTTQGIFKGLWKPIWAYFYIKNLNFMDVFTIVWIDYIFYWKNYKMFKHTHFSSTYWTIDWEIFLNVWVLFDALKSAGTKSVAPSLNIIPMISSIDMRVRSLQVLDEWWNFVLLFWFEPGKNIQFKTANFSNQASLTNLFSSIALDKQNRL